MQVVNGGHVLLRCVAEIIGAAIDKAALHSRAREPDGHRLVVMIATDGPLFPCAIGVRPNSARNNERVVEPGAASSR